MGAAVLLSLIRVVITVIVTIAGPQPGDTLAVGTLELVVRAVAARHNLTLVDAELVIDQSEAARAHTPSLLTIGQTLGWLDTAAIVEGAGTHAAALPVLLVDLDIPGRVVQSLDHLLHVGARVFLSPVQSSQLEICPVDEVSVNSDGEWINGGCHQQLSVLSGEVTSLYCLPDSISEVQHTIVIINC